MDPIVYVGDIIIIEYDEIENPQEEISVWI